MHKDITRRSGESSLLASTAILLTALAMGCAMGEDPISGSEPEIEEPEATILAEIITGDGVEYTFLATEAGDVGLAVMAPDRVDSWQLPEADTSLAELYQSISGQPAPEALVAAEKRADERARSSEDPAAGEDAPSQLSPGDTVGARSDELPEGVAARTLAMSASDFQKTYCPGGHDFLVCYPQTNVQRGFQASARFLRGVIHTPNCPVYYRYRYYEGGQWKLFRAGESLKGWTWSWSMRGKKIPRLWESRFSPACNYRFSAYGTY